MLALEVAGVENTQELRLWSRRRLQLVQESRQKGARKAARRSAHLLVSPAASNRIREIIVERAGKQRERGSRVKLENKSSLETAKGRGTARAPPRSEVYLGSGTSIGAAPSSASDLDNTSQRSSAGESNPRTIRARPAPRFAHFGRRRPSPERPKRRTLPPCSCRRRPRPRRRCI